MVSRLFFFSKFLIILRYFSVTSMSGFLANMNSRALYASQSYFAIIKRVAMLVLTDPIYLAAKITPSCFSVKHY